MRCIGCNNVVPDEARFCPRCGLSLRPSTQDPFIGKKLDDRYLVLEAIGEGGSGKVYLARHIQLGKRIAVKILHNELAQNEKALKKFRKEALSVGELENEHIIKIFDFGQADGTPYFAMELLTGETLSTALNRKSFFSFKDTYDIITQICEGLAETHALGFVHRDLRPRNIMLTTHAGKDNFVKILDFGLAKMVVGGDPGKSGIGFSVGDPTYTAPEQMKSGTIDARADLYSLGIIAYHMLSGHAPYSGNNVFEIMGKHLDAPYPPIEGTIQPLPSGVDYILAKSLSKSPENRFKTALQFKEALQGLLKMHLIPVKDSNKEFKKGISYIDLQSPFPLADSAKMVRLAGGGVIRSESPPVDPAAQRVSSSQNSAVPAPDVKKFQHNRKMDVLVGINAADLKHQLEASGDNKSPTEKIPTEKKNEQTDPSSSLIAAAPSESFIRHQDDLIIERQKKSSQERKFWLIIIIGGVALALLLYFLVSRFTKDDKLPDFKKNTPSKTETADKPQDAPPQMVADMNSPSGNVLITAMDVQSATPVVVNNPMTEPVMTEPVMTEPVMTEPVMAEPVMTEPVMTEPVMTEPVKIMIPDKIDIPVIMKPVDPEPAKDPASLLKKAQTEYNNGNFSAAYSTYKSLLAKTPSSATALSGMASVCFELGKTQEAEKYLAKLVNVASTANNWYRLGSARQKLGKTPAAIEAYKKALSKNPNFEPAKRALAKLTGG